jgi:putative ABC transport system permease protein
MIRNYILSAIRSIKRDLLYSSLNIIGFTFGITSCILILIYIQNELSYDNFHENVEQIYRMNMKFNVGTNKFNVDMTPIPLAKEMMAEYPEVTTATRLFHKNYRGEFAYVRYQNDYLREERFFWADSNVFDVFTIPLIEGNLETVLNEPYSVVVTTEMAEKYFGQQNPVGNMIMLEDGSKYKITGITEGMPVNSHFKFDFLATFASLNKSRDPEWYDFAAFTYILLNKNASPHELESKLPELSRKNYTPVVQQTMGVTYDQFIEAGNYMGFFLDPLSGVHLNSDIAGTSLEPTGDINTVYIFAAIALIILLVACINFINLSTARSGKRAREVGIRKVVGSTRKLLILQFLSESIFISAFAVCSALLVVSLLLPYFNELIVKNLSLALLVNTWYFIPGLIGLILIVGVVAGSYPAFLLASYKPVTVLKGITPNQSKRNLSRNLMVVFQFVASVVLFIGTIVIYQQLNYIRNKNLGFNKDHIVVIKSAQKLKDTQESFKQQLKRNSKIIGATFSDSLPQMLLEVKIFHKEGAVDDQNHTLITISADHDFIETYQIEMDSGRYFSRQMLTDDNSIILNSAALNVLGIGSTARDRIIRMGRQDSPLSILGVVHDLHFEPLHYEIQPMAFLLLKERPGVLMSVRIRPDEVEETISYIKESWEQFVPGQPIEFVFFDEEYNQLYSAEIQAGKVLAAFSLIAILIASMGLFGIAAFTSEQRKKEIGIRKVMGATASGIILLLNKDLVKLVFIANVIAYPIAYFAVNQWLQEFAYRIEISLWMFVSATFLAFIIALITVSYQTLKAANTNPAETTKYE